MARFGITIISKFQMQFWNEAIPLEKYKFECMDGRIRENIDIALALVKDKIGPLLENEGYQLVMDIHHKEGIETRIFQWANPSKNHTIQIIWDSKEDWFDLGDFPTVGDLYYRFATHIKLVQFRKSKWINRNTYIYKVIDELVEEVRKLIEN